MLSHNHAQRYDLLAQIRSDRWFVSVVIKQRAGRGIWRNSRFIQWDAAPSLDFGLPNLEVGIHVLVAEHLESTRAFGPTAGDFEGQFKSLVDLQGCGLDARIDGFPR